MRGARRGGKKRQNQVFCNVVPGRILGGCGSSPGLGDAFQATGGGRGDVRGRRWRLKSQGLYCTLIYHQ